jgi:hypothetical protein
VIGSSTAPLSSLGILLALLAGCVDSDAERQAQREAAFTSSAELQTLLRDGEPVENGNPDVLVFRLAFASEVDLDLYVTDPLLETVYFANHHTQTGGALVNDARCGVDDVDQPRVDQPRVEEIRFDRPYAGRYRVGVDFPERCDGGDGPAGYAVSVVGAGSSYAARGSIELEQFEVVVLEFDLEGKSR